MRVYDKNLIIALNEPNFLKIKCYESQIPTEVINIQFDIFGIMLKLSEEDKKKLSQLTSYSHLYINAHGIEGDPFLIKNNSDDSLTYLELANIIILAKTGPRNTLSGLRITLDICYAAKKYTIPSLNHIDKSFADLLQEHLIHQGIDNVDIVAYTETTAAIIPYSIKNKTYKFNGRSSEITNLEQQIAYILSLWKTLDMPSLLADEMTISRITSSIEIAILIFKQWNRLIPNQKILFSHDNKYPISFDYYQEKSWENAIEYCFNAAGLPILATAFSQKRTFRDKLCFFRNLLPNQNAALTENANAPHHSQRLKF